MSHSARQRPTDAPETWYGEPQHETDVDEEEAIEFERYGEPVHERPSGSFEFVSGIEYYPGRTTPGRKAGRTGRRMATLLLGD
jgi:hypothetical protein